MNIQVTRDFDKNIVDSGDVVIWSDKAQLELRPDPLQGAFSPRIWHDANGERGEPLSNGLARLLFGHDASRFDPNKIYKVTIPSLVVWSN